MSASVAVMIGNFDGVHLGHAALVRRARSLVDGERRGRVIAKVFYPHPSTVLRPGSAPAELTWFERRSELLRSAGVDEVVRLEPTPELLGLSPAGFIERMVTRFRPTVVVEGPDFRFGKDRSGDVATLRALGEKLGFEVAVVAPVEAVLTDQHVVAASSTLVRWLVMHGRIADAERILGRPHAVSGVVMQGDQRGRAIGFPTANLETSGLLPGDGVYAGIAMLPGGCEHAAAIHVGGRSTFQDPRRTLEAYILGWAGPLAEGGPEYGWPLTLSFVSRLRDQARFESVPALVAQIRRDVERTREALAARAGAVAAPVRAARGQEIPV